MPDFAPLTDRWRPADWSPGYWTATIPNFHDPANAITITLELLTNGKCEWSISGAAGVNIGQDIAVSVEGAANASVCKIRDHFRNHHKSPQYVLGYLPWTTDRQLRSVFDATISSVTLWRKGERAMAKGMVTVACRLMGMRGYARGGGEI
jgi:hypothetical protein